MSKSKPKCKFCKTKTINICAGCSAPICSNHLYISKHQSFCKDCIVKVRKKGLIITWGIVGTLLLVLLLVIKLT